MAPRQIFICLILFSGKMRLVCKVSSWSVKNCGPSLNTYKHTQAKIFTDTEDPYVCVSPWKQDDNEMPPDVVQYISIKYLLYYYVIMPGNNEAWFLSNFKLGRGKLGVCLPRVFNLVIRATLTRKPHFLAANFPLIFWWWRGEERSPQRSRRVGMSRCINILLSIPNW